MVITLNSPDFWQPGENQFRLTSGAAASFHLLQMNQLGGTWTTNAGAVLTTNAPGSSFQFTTTNGPAARFYRVKSTVSIAAARFDNRGNSFNLAGEFSAQ